VNSKQLWGGIQLGLGAIALFVPNPIGTLCAGAEAPVPDWVIRLLGARIVGQGSFLLIRPTNDVVMLGCAFDGLHGVSMLATAVVKPDYRRGALVSAALATASVLIGVKVKQ
jgi:hypothetical protein